MPEALLAEGFRRAVLEFLVKERAITGERLRLTRRRTELQAETPPDANDRQRQRVAHDEGEQVIRARVVGGAHTGYAIDLMHARLDGTTNAAAGSSRSSVFVNGTLAGHSSTNRDLTPPLTTIH